MSYLNGCSHSLISPANCGAVLRNNGLDPVQRKTATRAAGSRVQLGTRQREALQLLEGRLTFETLINDCTVLILLFIPLHCGSLTTYQISLLHLALISFLLQYKLYM